MPAAPRLRRRAVLGGAVALTAAACDPGEDIGTPPGASGSAAPTPASPSPTAAPSPDQALVEETGARLHDAVAVLVAARRFPTLRAPVTATLRAHRRHVAVLEVDDDQDRLDARPVDAATALREVRRSERALHADLVEAAGRAESGALARLLAVVAASTSQHLAALPSGPEGA